MSSRPTAPANPPGTITSEILTIDRIEVSPYNVRRHRATIEAVAATEASILARGLMQPLSIHPMRGSKDSYGAFAGGRRTRAIRNLVARGELPADWPVDVKVYRGFSDVQIIELSLTENIQRAELELYEVCAGIRALVQRGETAEAIAEAIGQPLALVRKWQRVGNLAEPIFAAFAEERISGDDARAYAATTDQALQLAVYEQLRALPDWQRTPERIRAAMKIGDRQLARLLRLVGDDAYRAAGGSFELDLFADSADQRGRIVDEGKLQALANARLDEVRKATRAAVGRELRFAPEPPKLNGYPDTTLQVTPKKGAEGKLILPEGEIVAAIELSDAGEPTVSYWWESRKAKFGSGSSATVRAREPREKVDGSAALSSPYQAAPLARAVVKDEHGVSADALEAMRSVRRELLRALIVEDAQRQGNVGRDFVTWAHLRVFLKHDAVGAVGARCAGIENTIGVSYETTKAAAAHVEQQLAHDIWQGAIREVSAQSFIVEPDFAAAFVDFLNAGERVKLLAGAVLSGLILERGANAPGFRLGAHDALAQMTRGTPATLRRLWSPTAEFLSLLPKAQILAIAEPLVGPETLARWSKVKAAELPNLLAQALAGGGNAVAARNRQAAAEWIHPLLAFRALDLAEPEPSAEPVEAVA